MSTRRINPGTVIASIALVFALAGSAIALPGKGSVDKNDLAKNIVKSKHIKDGQVKTNDLGAAAVTSDKLADGSVTTAKIAANAVDGAKIADGAVTGAKAGSGVLRDMVTVTDREPDSGESVTATKQAFPTCPAGYVITGGGGRILDDDGAPDYITDVNMPIIESAPGFSQWFLQATDKLVGDDDDWALLASAICVKA